VAAVHVRAHALSTVKSALFLESFKYGDGCIRGPRPWEERWGSTPSCADAEHPARGDAATPGERTPIDSEGKRHRHAEPGGSGVERSVVA